MSIATKSNHAKPALNPILIAFAVITLAIFAMTVVCGVGYAGYVRWQEVKSTAAGRETEKETIRKGAILDPISEKAAKNMGYR